MKKRLTRISTGRVIFMCTALIVIYFLGTFAMNLIQSQQLNDEEARLLAEIEDLSSRYERLQKLEVYLNSDAYIEAIAREQLGLVKEGEVSFVAISTVPTATPAPGEEPPLWWQAIAR
ncbi:MAG: septum formation initiator family protein [Dehalococcoidia bacterium]